MVITSAILGMIALVGAAVLMQIRRFYLQNSDQLSLQTQSRVAMNLMTRNLRQARASTVIIDSLSGEAPYSRIAFTKQSGDAQAYYVAKGVLYSSSTTDLVRVMTQDVTFAAFGYPRTDDDAYLSVAFAVKKAMASHKEKIYMWTEKVRVQNE